VRQNVPRIDLVLYQEDDKVPVAEWLQSIDESMRERCLALIQQLREMGCELRMPHAKSLKGVKGFWELRPNSSPQVGKGMQFRILYFFHSERPVVVLAHGCTKKKNIPQAAIDTALKRKRKFEQNPERHSAPGPPNYNIE
jgi:hypothetical protein